MLDPKDGTRSRTVNVLLTGTSEDGSDGTRTRDLRRDSWAAGLLLIAVSRY